MVADYFFVIQNSKGMYLAVDEEIDSSKFYYTDNILECKRFLVRSQAENCINIVLNDRNVRVKKVLVNVEDY